MVGLSTASMFLFRKQSFLVTFFGIFVIYVFPICSVVDDNTVFKPDFTSTQNQGSETKVKVKEWLDPGDMLGTDISSFRKSDSTEAKPNAEEEKVEKSHSAKEASHEFMGRLENFDQTETAKSSRSCEMPYFKQLTRVVLETFQRPGKHYATIKLSENNLKRLNEFKDKDVNGESIHDVFDIISGIFNKVEEDERQKFTFWSHVEMVVVYNKELFAVIAIIIMLIVTLLVFETHTSKSWYQQFWYLLSGLFIISIPWEWFRMYRQEFARKQSAMIKEIPRHCIGNNMTILQSVSIWMSNLLQWKGDECARYQEAILVDPIWEVSPSQAFSITATRFIIKPLEYIADTCGKSFNKFFVQIPAQWQPLMFLGILMILTLALLLFTKSRIRLGFFEIGPNIQPPMRLKNEDIAALADRVCNRVGEIMRGTTERRREVRRIAAVHDEKLEHSIDRGIPDTQSPVFDIPIREDVYAVKD